MWGVSLRESVTMYFWSSVSYKIDVKGGGGEFNTGPAKGNTIC
jgi:hypothetical protein